MRRKPERRPARMGCMEVERPVSTTPVFLKMLIDFGIVPRDAKFSGHGGWAEFEKVSRDLVVTRVRERLKREGKLQQRAGLFSCVQETQAALEAMSETARLKLRGRLVLNDFRLDEEDQKGD